jgi:hypothetical protein
VAEQTCTCGHFVHRGEICKHITAATTSTEGRAAAPTHAARALAVSCDSGNRRDNPFMAAELQVAGIQHPSAAGPKCGATASSRTEGICMSRTKGGYSPCTEGDYRTATAQRGANRQVPLVLPAGYTRARSSHTCADGTGPQDTEPPPSDEEA